MNKKLLLLYCFTFFLLNDFVMFAQPGDDDNNGGLDDVDPAPAPINGKIIFLFITGLLFAVYTFRKNSRKVS